MQKSGSRVRPDFSGLPYALPGHRFQHVSGVFPLASFCSGIFAQSHRFRGRALAKFPTGSCLILPPGSMTVIAAYFVRRVARPWRWMLLGLVGTLLAGSQVMVGYMEGFRIIEGDLLGSELLVEAVACSRPSLPDDRADAFGGCSHRVWQADSRLAHARNRVGHVDAPSRRCILCRSCFRTGDGSARVALTASGAPVIAGYCNLFPGAAVSTVLWWTVDISFSFYMRKMPYDFVYRGLAAAIGLLLWMFLTAIVVLIGAAYNAEVREAEEEVTAPARLVRPLSLNSLADSFPFQSC